MLPRTTLTHVPQKPPGGRLADLHQAHEQLILGVFIHLHGNEGGYRLQ